jgi:DNA-binding transcriptional regulator YdaS (Cro superfamily)
MSLLFRAALNSSPTKRDNMYLQWKKSGRSVCGKYQANKAGAYYGESKNALILLQSTINGDVSENRAICQRHAWATLARQTINYALMQLATPGKTGAAVLSHELQVDSSQVSRWKLGRALVPADRCDGITRLCNVVSVTPALLRPDLEFYSDAKTNDLKWRKRSAISGGAES